MKRILLISFLLPFLYSYSQEKDINAFIPENYEIRNELLAKGDLNRDGIEDVAMALFPAWEKDAGWLEEMAD